jgi:hypothetical protein
MGSLSKCGVGATLIKPMVLAAGVAAALLVLPLTGSGCAAAKTRAPALASSADAVAPSPRAKVLELADHPQRMLADIERRTFEYFWNTTDPATGLSPDRWPTPSPSSIAAVGFALTADVVGAYRGYVSRHAAAERARTTLAFLASRPQGPGAAGYAGYHGLFYHFLDMKTGVRYQDRELSTIDTALLMAGVLTAESYFNRDTALERSLRRLARRLYRNVDWRWTEEGDPRVRMAWLPETGFDRMTWDGYNEGSLIYILGMGSPTHPLQRDAWDAWSATDPQYWKSMDGQTFLTFGPQFAHQYTAIWVDFRGITSGFMAIHHTNFFQNGQRATFAQQRFAMDNPHHWTGYNKDIWGLTACDGPGRVVASYHGHMHKFHSYAARGITSDDVDDGTLAPTAMVASLPFAPTIVTDSVVALMRKYGDIIYTRYGFLDSFNPSFTDARLAKRGHVIPGRGWVDGDFIGIDQGPILEMIENQRSGLIWRLLRGNPYVRAGLLRAGFVGRWLDHANAAPEPARQFQTRRTGPRGSSPPAPESRTSPPGAS